MATHSSVLAWRIPRTGEPGGLPSVGSHRVGHNWRDLVAAAATLESITYFSHLLPQPPCWGTSLSQPAHFTWKMYQPLTVLPIAFTLLSTAWEHSLKHNHVTPCAEKAWGCGLRKVCLAPGWNLGTCILGWFSSGENSSLCLDCFCKRQCGLCWIPAFLRAVWNFWSLEGTHVTTS